MRVYYIYVMKPYMVTDGPSSGVVEQRSGNACNRRHDVIRD